MFPQTSKISPPIFIWILITLAGLIGSIELYLQFHPSPEPRRGDGGEVSNWKTYRNEEYGFEFKYPNNLELWGSISNTDYNLRYPASSRDSIVISKNEPLRIEAYSGKVKWVDDGEMSLSFVATTTFNNYPASKGKYCDLGGCVELIILEKNLTTYQLNFDKSILNNQILSTFKFISTSTDSRILLTPENVRKYNDAVLDKPEKNAVCGYDLDYSDPIDKVGYSNNGISFSVPFNNKWGGLKFRLNPYDESDDRVQFGYMFSFEGCGWIRVYTLDFLLPKSKQEVIQEIQKNNFIGNSPPIEKKIGNVDTLEYIDGELCPQPYILILGSKYNYQFSRVCSDDFTDLEEIIKTVKIIN